MSIDTLRVGILGIGLYSTIAHVPQLRATGKAEVVALARRSADRLDYIKQQLGVDHGYTDWRELLMHPELDAVVISTPHDLHFEQGMAALERGLHVLMEKPLALTSEEAWTLIAAAERAQKTMMVGYNRRFMSPWRTLKESLDAGVIGQIRQVNLQYTLYRRMYWEGKKTPEVRALLKQLTGWPDAFFDEWEAGADWHTSPVESGGGMFSNSGSHLVDLVLWLAGSGPTEVVAFSESLGMPAECFLNIQARLENGVLVSITSGDVAPGGFAGQGSLTLIGEEGIAGYDFGKPQEIWLTRNGAREQLVPTVADTNVAAAFVSALLDGGPNLCPPRDAAQTVAFSEAVYRSAAENRIVKIEKNGVRA